MTDEDEFEYEMLTAEMLMLWKEKEHIKKKLAKCNLSMMEIERRRPDIVAKKLLEGNYESSNDNN